MLSWVGEMVNIFPQSLDAVGFGVRRKTITEGASLMHSQCGSKWLNQLFANAGSPWLVLDFMVEVFCACVDHLK